MDGFGIAMPAEIWSWSKEIGVDPKLLDVWRDLVRSGEMPVDPRQDRNLWQCDSGLPDKWLEGVASGIAYTIGSSLSVIDFQAVITDGELPRYQ